MCTGQNPNQAPALVIQPAITSLLQCLRPTGTSLGHNTRISVHRTLRDLVWFPVLLAGRSIICTLPARCLSNLLLKISEEGDSATALNNLSQCITTLTKLSLNCPSVQAHCFCPLLLEIYGTVFSLFVKVFLSLKMVLSPLSSPD